MTLTKQDLAHVEDGVVDSKLAVADEEPFIIDPEAERRLMRKVDLHLFPAVWVMLL